eukprot:scaffold15707_cov63-Phaeocystis_antarctica.AAC.2
MLASTPYSTSRCCCCVQADVLAGVFASTFVKSALQLGHASAYVSLDTFPWCPLLRCYWFWRDLCHNCEVCANQAGGGEACTGRGYHTALGLRHVLQGKRPVREPFRNFMAAAKRHSHCVPFADHPLGSTMYDAPVVNVDYAAPLPTNARPQEVCSVGGGGGSGGFGGGSGGCRCGFRRLQGVDNAALAQAKAYTYYGHAYYGHAYRGYLVYLPCAGQARVRLRHRHRAGPRAARPRRVRGALLPRADLPLGQLARRQLDMHRHADDRARGASHRLVLAAHARPRCRHLDPAARRMGAGGARRGGARAGCADAAAGGQRERAARLPQGGAAVELARRARAPTRALDRAGLVRRAAARRWRPRGRGRGLRPGHRGHPRRRPAAEEAARPC